MLTPEFSAYLDRRTLDAYAANLGPLREVRSFVLTGEEEADGITMRRYQVNANGRRLSVIWKALADGRTDDFAVQPTVE